MKRMLLTVVVIMPLLLAGNASGAPPGANGSGGHRDRVIVMHDWDRDRGWLGVSIADSDDAPGAVVKSVTQGSPAEKAGLRKGDIVLEVNGTRVSSRWDLLKEVREADPGSKAELLVQRAGKRQTLTATLGTAPEDFRTADVPPPMPPVPHFTVPAPAVPHFYMFGDAYGLSLMDLNGQLAEYFGAPGDGGALVEEVEKESPAGKAGFKAGDVIVAVGKDTVEDAGDFWSALERYKTGDTADVGILRKGAAQSLSLAVTQESRHAFGRRFRAPRPFRYDFHWDSERFEKQMNELGSRLGRLGKDLEHRMRGVEQRIKKSLERIEV